jgi:BirA family transcriptional regulator, biotin operon repressor / biotin---[acetyl-CoA-carboxylase] ligase
MSPIPALPAFDTERATASLRHVAIGHTLDYHEETDSTMALARSLARRSDVRSGTVVVAEHQTAGRGRLQRTWEAPSGRALLLSVILKDGHLPSLPGHVAMIGGIAVAHALDELLGTAATIGLKWPNDVVVTATSGETRDPQPRKIAGILIESSMLGEDMEYAVVGIGINVNQSAVELPFVAPTALHPSSVAVISGRSVDRTDLFVSLAHTFADALALPAVALVDQWRGRLWTLGRPVTAHLSDGVRLSGIAVDVTEGGSLLVDDGEQIHVVDAGDVSLRGEP